ncbi:MAG: hypothetical protein AAFX53_19770, partial [Bacteroidota bacterium]
MDNFEKNIRENKALFDEHIPERDKMWARIASELEESRPKVIPLWRSFKFRAAASIVLVLGMGMVLGLSLLGTAGQNPQDTIISQELRDIDMHYKELVSHQVQLVQNHSKLSDADKTEFLLFMDELDQEYEALKLEMRKNLDNEVILEAIIANYKKRFSISSILF